MKIVFQLINAFVEGDLGGNPAGVVLDADALSDGQKQRIAQRVGYSETAFVLASSSVDFKLDFFTPTRRIAHCGHATIATFSYLAQLGRVTGTQTSKETVDAKRAIELRGELAFMEQTAPVYGSLVLFGYLLFNAFMRIAKHTNSLAPEVMPQTISSKEVVKAFLKEVRSGKAPEKAPLYMAPTVLAHQMNAEDETTVRRSPGQNTDHVREFLALYGNYTSEVTERIAEGDKEYAFLQS